MKTFFHFAKTTFLGGVVFLTPLMVAWILVREALNQVSKIVKPLGEWLQVKSVIGIQTPYLLACLLLLFVCFLAGLAAKTRIGVSVRDAADRWLTAHVPGYIATKRKTKFGPPPKIPEKMTSVLVLLGDSWRFAFLMDRPKPGWSTVFVPNAPGTNSGSVHLVPESQVKTIGASSDAVSYCLAGLGSGSQDLLDDWKKGDLRA